MIYTNSTTNYTNIDTQKSVHFTVPRTETRLKNASDFILLRIKVRVPVLLCAVKTVEGDFRFCWTISPNVGQTHKENPKLVRIFI